MCQACKAITELILAGATSASAVADFVIDHADAAQKGEPAPPATGEHHDATQDRNAY